MNKPQQRPQSQRPSGQRPNESNGFKSGSEQNRSRPAPQLYPNHMGLLLKLIAGSLLIIAFVLLGVMLLIIMNLDTFVEIYEMMQHAVDLLERYVNFKMEEEP